MAVLDGRDRAAGIGVPGLLTEPLDDLVEGQPDSCAQVSKGDVGRRPPLALLTVSSGAFTHPGHVAKVVASFGKTQAGRAEGGQTALTCKKTAV